MGLEVEVVGDNNKFDVIVIGGGVAGMSASCAVTEAGLKSCFLERDVPGGKLMQIQKVHSFPSMPDVEGNVLAQSFLTHATSEVKTTYAFGDVKAIRPRNDLFYIFTGDGQTWEAKAIIICTGTSIKKLDVSGETEYFNKGLTYCVRCDGSLSKGKKVVLVGGNSEQIEFLKQFTTEITVLKPEDVRQIIGNGTVTGVLKQDGSQIDCEYVFVENGYQPETSFLPNDIKLNENREIIVNATQATSFPGAYAAGDCTNSKIKMIQPAIVQAYTAAKNAVIYVKSRHW